MPRFLYKLLQGLYGRTRGLLRAHYRSRVLITAASVGPGLRVNGKTNVTPTTHLGKNVHFNGMRIQGCGQVRIGDNFHSGPDCLMIAEIHDFDTGNAIPYDTARYLERPITIEDNVWLGSRVIVLGGVTIGEGSIIQAGSCVVSDIPKYAIAGGHPAKAFKQRDIDHYERLKAAGRFH